eukprot:361726_1
MDKRHILTIGYVHNIKMQCNLAAIVPSEIVNIIYLYHKYCDTWNKKYISNKYIEFDEHSNQVTTLTNSINTIYGNIVLENGSYTWQLKLIKSTWQSKQRNNQQPFIGFIVDEHSILERYKDSYDWYCPNGYIFCGGDETCGADHINTRPHWTYHTEDGILFFHNDDDILEITLDLDKRTISLSVNGCEPIIPKSFDGSIKKNKYRLVVTFEGIDNAIQLL